MGARGPDTTFKPDYCGLARRVAMLGATNDDLASIIGVSRRTIGNWLQEHPEFKAAVEEGKLRADANVAEKLYQRAIGYERPAVRYFASPEGGDPKPVEYTHHHAPDTAAAIFWLRNRRRADWREQVEHRHTTSEELLTVLEAARLRARVGQPGAGPPGSGQTEVGQTEAGQTGAAAMEASPTKAATEAAATEAAPAAVERPDNDQPR